MGVWIYQSLKKNRESLMYVHSRIKKTEKRGESIMKKITISMIAILFVLSLALSACTNSEGNGGSSNGDSGDKTTVQFWHSMTGDNEDALKEIVDDFNDQSDDVHVEATFQGSYDESLTKLRALGGSEEAPALVQVFEIGTKFMSESDFVTPMQEFVDDDDDFDLDSLEESILNYYTVNDDLYSMPFNSSNAVMFYNKDMFEDKGLDPEDPPATFSEMEDAAEKLTDDDTYGFTMATIGWFVEQLLANSEALYLDNENGRSDDATEALVDSDEGVEIFNWLNDMNQAGTFKNYGGDWEDPRGPFFAEQVGMYFDSTANTAEIIKNSDFEVGTAFLPAPDGQDPNGLIIGGASTWMTNKVDDDVQEAAWEFVKYTTEADVQAKWAAATGYFPTNPDSYDEDVLNDVYEEYPQYKTAVDQLEETNVNPETAGPLTEAMPEARKIIEASLEGMYDGQDPKKAVEEAAEKITEALD